MQSERTEDHALLARIVDGDRVALEILYRRHAGWLTARLQSRCGNAEATDLAVQDTFLAVWRSAKKFRGDGDVGAWIWGIGIRRLIDQLRKRSASPVDTATLNTLTASSADPGRHVAPSPEDRVLAAHGEAHAAVDRLDPDLRAVMVATAIDGLTTKETAKLLGVPQGTVKTRLMRARQQLQDQLGAPT